VRVQSFKFLYPLLPFYFFSLPCLTLCSFKAAHLNPVKVSGGNAVNSSVEYRAKPWSTQLFKISNIAVRFFVRVLAVDDPHD